MSERQRLPNRRAAVSFNFQHGELCYRATVGFYDDGSAGELFLNCSKQNSALDAFAADAAILISLLLQRGATIAEIGHALRQTPAGGPASLIGAAVYELGKIVGQP